MKRTVLYKGKPYIVIEDGGSGLLRIAETEVKKFGQVTGYTGDIRYVEKDEISQPPAHWDRIETGKSVYQSVRENLEKARMKHVEVLCEFCSDPIYEGEGRTRIGGKDYHRDSQSDCFMESVKLKAESERVIEKCAESMLYDKRITA